MSSWDKRVSAITLFVDDVERSRSWYAEAFGLPVVYQDEESVVFDFGGTLINLLKVTAAPELIDPAKPTEPDAGNSFQLTIPVADVDAICDELRARGISLLNGPMDRPWGPRTASFQDPDGHIWEIASE